MSATLVTKNSFQARKKSESPTPTINTYKVSVRRREKQKELSDDQFLSNLRQELRDSKCLDLGSQAHYRLPWPALARLTTILTNRAKLMDSFPWTGQNGGLMFYGVEISPK